MIATLIITACVLTVFGGWMQLAWYRQTDMDVAAMRMQEDELLEVATHPAPGHLTDHLGAGDE